MIYTRNDFDDWKRGLRSMLLQYGVGGGQVLSEDELKLCYYQRGFSIHTVFSISSDVANGFSFEDAVASNSEFQL